MTSAAMSFDSALTLPTFRSGAMARIFAMAWSTSSSRWARTMTRRPRLGAMARAGADRNSLISDANTTVLPAPVGSTMAGRCMPPAQASNTASMASL